MYKGIEIKPPFFEIGPKAYLFGEEMLKLAKAADEAANKYDVQIILTPQYTDIRLLVEETKTVLIFAQHMDPIHTGRGLGSVLPEAIKAAGAHGVMLNHAEKPITISDLNKAIKRADEVGLVSIVCADTIEEAIFPVGFWRRKAQTLIRISSILVSDYQSHVPSNMDDLLGLPGVGRKTANLVLSVAFDKPSICVDTHVHRIMNRLGFVRTTTPDKTEWSLRADLPKESWKKVNRILVIFGRNVCTPVSPICSICEVSSSCERVGVDKSR